MKGKAGMEDSAIRITITLRLETVLSRPQTQKIMQNLSAIDGICALRLADASGGLIRISFDPYRISARDILKWFAQQAIKAELLAPLPNEPSATPNTPTLHPTR